jgi:integrative and conjugative element protein (TIGR02256 family)
VIFTDWRSDSILANGVLRKLQDLGFTEIVNDVDKPLQAIRKLRRKSPEDHTLILVFPQNYPLTDIQPHLKSPYLRDKFIQQPIKHLAPSLYFLKEFITDGILGLCLRGPWNNRDLTDPSEVLDAVNEWITDYTLGGIFPDDFDLPENTFFSPHSNIGRTIFIDSFFLSFEQPYFKSNSPSFGTFELAICQKPCIGLLTELIDYGGSPISLAKKYSLPESQELFYRLTSEKMNGIVKGLWQYSDVPPSPFAWRNKSLTIPDTLCDFYWKEHIKLSQNIFLDGYIVIIFFFPLFGRPTAILTLIKNEFALDDINESMQKVEYLKPHILSREDLYSRLGRSINAEKIQQSAIGFFGVGALGSQVALHFARTGFQKFIIVDKEILTPGNVMRHSGFLLDVGKEKSQVVAKQIMTVNPYAKVEAITKDLVDPSFNFEALNGNLVISTLADDRVEQYINRKLCGLGITAVYGRTTTSSYACRVIRVGPKEDACLKCYEYYARFKDERYILLNDEKISRDDLVFQGCTAPSFLGANFDIATYATIIARIAFNETGVPESRFHHKFRGNHFLFSSRLVNEEPKISQPFSLVEDFFNPLAGCPHCGNADLPYRCIVMAKEAIEKIKHLSQKSNGVETGGVLIGTVAKIEEGLVLIICHATLPGKRAIQMPAYFDRDKGYCGNLVKEYHSASEGDLNYVGEWHSHPTRDITPSWLDDTSLFRVAYDKGYAIKNPISIIQSSENTLNTGVTVYTDKGAKYNDSLIVTPLASIKQVLRSKKREINLTQDLD